MSLIKDKKIVGAILVIMIFNYTDRRRFIEVMNQTAAADEFEIR